MRMLPSPIPFVAVLIVAYCGLPSRPAAGQDFSQLTALAEGALAGEHVAEAVPGFEIRLLHEGQVLYHRAFGEWMLDRPARADSSTKTLSGALLMSIDETGEGGFSLDSSVSDFLAEYDQPEYRDITVRRAFSHTAGFEGQDALSLILAAPNLTLRDAARLIQSKPLTNGPPGSSFAYGGLSMHVAGAAAEVATGDDYLELFASRITEPLGMTNTQFVTASQTNPRVAGGVESTATDFTRFMDMLLNDGVDRHTGTRVLSASAVQAMLTQQTMASQPIVNSPTDNHRYGIGVWLDQFSQFDSDGPTVDALAGGARGFHSWIDESHDLVFTFATDLSQFSSVEFLSSLMHRAILEVVSDPADFNFDGQVDGLDYLDWQLGGSAPSELAQWLDSYAPSGSVAATVPEPNGRRFVLFCVLALLAASPWRLSRRFSG